VAEKNHDRPQTYILERPTCVNKWRGGDVKSNRRIHVKLQIEREKEKDITL